MENVLKFAELRENESVWIDFVILKVVQRSFFCGHQASCRVHRWVWNYLHVLVHYTRTWIVAWVEEHKGVHWRHCYYHCFEILYVQRVDLFLEFFCDDNHMPLANRKFVKYEAMSIC